MTEKKCKALAALLTEPTRSKAAEKAGINRKTLGEYLKDPEFAEEYQKAMRTMVDEAAEQSKKTLSPAVSVLLEIAEDKRENAQVRVSACRSLLEYGLKLTELNDIIRELED